MYWSPRRCCANVEFLRRGDQLLWTQSRKVRKLTRVQARPDHRIKRRLAFSLEFKSAKLLAAPKRIVSLVLRSRDAAEFVEPQKERATPEQGDTKELTRSEEHTSELQSRLHLVCRLLLEKKT